MLREAILVSALAAQPAWAEPARFWAQANYSSDSFDIFDYASEISRSTQFDDERGFQVGARFLTGLHAFDYQIWLVGEYLDREVRASRVREPRKLQFEQERISLGVEGRNENSTWHLTAHNTYFPEQTINKYQFGSVVLGEDVTFNDPDTLQQLPLLALQVEEYGVSLGYARYFEWHLPVTLSADYRFSHVQPDLNSVLFGITDEGLLNATIGGTSVRNIISQIRERLPQENAWNEHIVRLGLTHRFWMTDHWYIDGAAAAYLVQLTDYEGEDDFGLGKNVTGDLSLTYRASKLSEWYLRWHLASNYTLGIHPGTYNKQTEILFDHPYSVVSLGFRVPF